VEDILDTHEGVGMACVIGVPNEKWGEAVTAVVVRKAGSDVSDSELITLVKEKKGAVYAPKEVKFVDSIPLTGLGKPDKKAVRAEYWGDSDRQVG
jgi:fatty-acyl-CoA synthase